MQEKQAWSGRFNEPVAELVKRYTASVEFDNRLALFDIQGSRAHAQMLAACDIISTQDLDDINRGLAQIENEIISGDFEWSLDLEDVHLNIEKRLTTLVGDAGKRLHTGRSRNDQVATDVRLYLRHAIDESARTCSCAANCLVDLADASYAHHHAGLHPFAGGAAGELRPPPDGLFRDAQARYRALRATAANASTACRWEPPRWPAPAIRSNANTWRASYWASTACARTRWMPCPTAISRSSSPPPRRWS